MDNTAFQISSIRRVKHKTCRAFTLVEVMVGATLSSFVLAGVLSTFLMMGRIGTNVVNYSEAEAKARNALERFSREAHQAYSVAAGYNGFSVTLGMPDNTTARIPLSLDSNGANANGAYKVTYTFNTSDKTLERQIVGGGAPEILVTGVEQIGSTPFIDYYKYVTAGTNPPAGSGYQDVIGTNFAGNANAGEIKQIEFSFRIKRTNVTVATASNKVISARFILRNK
jgi:Tfp pilus assembly protein PilW